MSNEAGNPTGSAATTVEVDTLGADIEKAFDASVNSDAETTTDAGKTDVSEAARTLAAQRKAGEQKGADPAAVADGKDDAAKRAAERAAMAPEARAKADAEDKAKAAATEAVEAPAHWPAADREMFAKQAPEVKSWMLNRHKAMEADYTRKSQELGTTRRLKDTLDEVFAPFREQMQLNGVDEAAAIRQLVGAHAFLQRDPANAMKHLAQQYGIDLKQLVEGAAAADPAGESPTVKALRDQVTGLTKKLEQITGTQSQEEQNARLNTVTQFAEEKDGQGNLKRPYFDDVAQDVVVLLRGAKSAGQQMSLQDAYDRAVRANPATYEKQLAAKLAEQRSKDEAERKAKADAARKAGFDVRGEGAASAVAAQTDSIDASLNAAWDAAAGRV